MKNILVIGGAGYIGSHVCLMLQNKGYNVIVLDNLSNGHEQAVQNFKLIVDDLSNETVISNIIKNYKIDAVMHFAAFIEVGESVKNPLKYYYNNTIKVYRLLRTLIQNNIKYFVFSSTAATFGEPKELKIDENHSQIPINAYGNTKLCVEKMLKDFSIAYDFKYSILRYFNACGADDSGFIGESHNPETHLIPLILKTAKGERKNIKIFGNDYNTKDGTCIRDYVHVNDLALAHILALENMLNNNVSEDFNLGSENGYSVLEIINLVKEITKINFDVEVVNRREGDPAILVADSAKIRNKLGWIPKYSINSIIETAWNWECNRRY